MPDRLVFVRTKQFLLTPHKASCGATPVGTSWGRAAGAACPECDPRKAWALFPASFVAPPAMPAPPVEPGFYSTKVGTHHIQVATELSVTLHSIAHDGKGLDMKERCFSIDAALIFVLLLKNCDFSDFLHNS